MKPGTLRILVPIKRVVDSNIRINVSKGIVDTSSLKHSMNPFDSIAVEEALRLRALSPGGEVTAVTIGGKKSAEVLQTALAMGADRVMHVITNNDAIAPLTIARILARIVKEKECNVAMVGKQAIDNDNGQTGSMLSALLSWPQASFAQKVAFEPEKMSLRVTTETDTGLRVVRVLLPAVIITELGLNTPRYVNLASIMKAKKKLVDTITLSDLNIEEIPPLEVEQVYAPPARPPCKFVNSVSELIEKLKEEKVI